MRASSSSIVLSTLSAALLLACSSNTIVSRPGEVEEETPGDPAATPSPTAPPTTDPPGPPPTSKPPAIAVDPSFSAISDTTHDLYGAVPGPNGAIFVTLRKAGGSIGWGNGTLVRRHGVDGARDAAFGAQGELDTRLVANPHAVTVDKAGNVLVAGTGLPEGSDTGREIVVVRITPAGAVDTTFGAGGRARVTSFGAANVWTSSVQAREDGGAFVSVWGRTNGKETFGSVLVSPSGGAVPGYGTNGFLSSPFTVDGAIVLGSDVAVPTTSGMLRFGPDGAQKGTFIRAGIPLARRAPDGSIVAIVSDGTTLGVERFTSQGAKDGAFARAPVTEDLVAFVPLADGSVIVAEGSDLSWIGATGGAKQPLLKGVSAAALALTTDGKLLVTSASGSRAKVVRYTL